MTEFEVVHSRAIRRFQDRIMDGQELVAFDLFFGRLKREPGGDGRKEFAHRGPRRTLHFSYYVSRKLRTVIVLMGYQARAGEPRTGELKDEQELLAAIHHKESDYERGIETA